MSTRQVGLIGIGLVGMALAERFRAAGWQVIGYDIDAQRRNDLIRLQGLATENPAAVVAATDVIVLSLPTSRIAADVLRNLGQSVAGKTFVDTTTGEPAEMAALGTDLAARGTRYLDATIAGSSTQVRAGEAVVMIGGEAATVADCDELFRSFAARTFHLGEWGAGARMKLVINLVLGLNRAVLAEGLSFAARCGVDPQRALEVLKAGPAYSKVMDSKGQKMLAEDFEPQARLAQHLKDVRLILSQGLLHDANLPLSTLHAELLEKLVQLGFGDLDNSAIMKAFP